MSGRHGIGRMGQGRGSGSGTGSCQPEAALAGPSQSGVGRGGWRRRWSGVERGGFGRGGRNLPTGPSAPRAALEEQAEYFRNALDAVKRRLELMDARKAVEEKQ